MAREAEVQGGLGFQKVEQCFRVRAVQSGPCAAGSKGCAGKPSEICSSALRGLLSKRSQWW